MTRNHDPDGYSVIDCTGVSIGNSDIEDSSVQGTIRPEDVRPGTTPLPIYPLPEDLPQPFRERARRCGMSEPVNDVLAVLRAARDSVPGDQLLAYCAAMADVSELIKAARRVDRTSRGLEGWHVDAMPEAMQRLRAALARVQGGAA